MEDQWYCNRGPQRFGPFSSAQLKQLAASGKLRPTDLIWKEGMPQPVPAGQANALFPNAAAEKKSASGETSSMPRRASVTTPTMRAAGGKDADAPQRPSPAENEQAEFSYRTSLRKTILAFPGCAALGAFFVYLALCSNLQVVGIPLPEAIGKPFLWALALFLFLGPFSWTLSFHSRAIASAQNRDWFRPDYRSPNKHLQSDSFDPLYFDLGGEVSPIRSHKGFDN